MKKLTLEAARKIIAAALAKAGELELKPLAVVILDAGGHLKAAERQDGAANLRCRIAEGKAFGALGVGSGSRALFKRAEQQPYFVQALNGVAGGAVVPVPGGVLLRDDEGDVLGAVGISGDTSDNDETCAVTGIEAAGFTADVG